MSESKNVSKRQMRREQIRRKEMRGRLVGIGLITVGALFVAFLFIWPSLKPIAGVQPSEDFPRPQAEANSMGDPNAPIKIVEFSDFQCPFCKRFFQQTEKQLVDAYISTGKVYFTYRSAGNWVSQNMGTGGTESRNSAEAAYCAGDQNKFWEMHDALFNNVLGEEVNSFTDRRLELIAQEAGLNMSAYKECYGSNKFAGQVDQDLKDALAAGVQGTPSFVVTYTKPDGSEGRQLIEGAQPFSEFQNVIEGILAEIGG